MKQVVDRVLLKDHAEKQRDLLLSVAPADPDFDLTHPDREYRRHHGALSAMLDVADGLGACPCEWDSIHTWFWTYPKDSRAAEVEKRFAPFLAILVGDVAQLPKRFSEDIFEADNGSIPYFSFFDSLSETKQIVLDRLLDKQLTRADPEALKKAKVTRKTRTAEVIEYRISLKGSEIRNLIEGDGQPVPPVGLPKEDVIELRVFFIYENAKVILFDGFDKGEDPSDKRGDDEIRRAEKKRKEYVRQLERAAAAARKGKT